MSSSPSLSVKEDLLPALADRLLAMADDELILGHRDSEWCGYAPILEEDIAFANIALDEIGHAVIWYSLLADLSGMDRETFPDQQVYFRHPGEFRNVRLVELPNQDWAFSMLRQYLFDTFESLNIKALVSSQYSPLAEAAAKIQGEEQYHLRHTRAWMRRLGHGTEESRRRLQIALDDIWPFAHQLLYLDSDQTRLVSLGIIPPPEQLSRDWQEQVSAELSACGLITPPALEESQTEPNQRPVHRSQHTSHLTVLVAELQSVARLEPGASW